MNALPEAISRHEDRMTVSLSDARKISVPLAWFPRLLQATSEQLPQVELSRHGLHGDALKKALPVAGLLADAADMTQRNASAPWHIQFFCAKKPPK